MPRYFFDLHNDVDAEDEEGKDFPDLRGAIDHALREACTKSMCARERDPLRLAFRGRRDRPARR